RCPDGSRGRHACRRWRSDLAGILGRAQDDGRCHGLDLEAREHEWLLAVRAIACDQSGCLGGYPAATDLGKSEAGARTSVQAGRGRRGSPPSDRRPALRQSGVGWVVTALAGLQEGISMSPTATATISLASERSWIGFPIPERSPRPTL